MLGLNTQLLRKSQIIGVVEMEDTSEKIATAINM
tara:strand:- start:993 stop:1094 length:102 start_codon:yes stop_codon:yes gene_type:complete